MITSVVAQKGGVGKSTIAAHLAHNLKGNTLLIDLDPQASVTRLCGLEPSISGTYNFLKGEPLALTVEVSPWGFDVLVGAAMLAKIEQQEDAFKLVDLLHQTKDYKNIVIDCPPSVGFLPLNALIASDDVILITEPSILSMYGVAEALDSIESIQKNHNPKLNFLGVVVNKTTRTRESKKRVEELSIYVGKKKILAQIPLRTAVVEAAGEFKPCESLTFKMAIKPALKAFNG